MIKRSSQILTRRLPVRGSALDRRGLGRGLLPAFRVRLDPGGQAARWTCALCLSNLPLVVLLAAVAYRLTGQYSHPPAAPLPRGSGRRHQGHGPAVPAGDGHHLLPARSLRVAGHHAAVLGADGGRGARRPAAELGADPAPAQPRLQPDLRRHRRHRPRGPQDGPGPAPRQLDGHQEPRLRRGPAQPLDQRPGHPGHAPPTCRS